MPQKPSVGHWSSCALFCLGCLVLAVGLANAADVGGPPVRSSQAQPGVAAVVEARLVEGGVAESGAADDGSGVRPNHPPLDQIPPIPMPEPIEQAATGEPVGVVFHDGRTGETVTVPGVTATTDAFGQGGGYAGLDGGGGMESGDRSFFSMSAISNTGDAPWRMNCKIVMRFADGGGGSHYFVGSGSMIDAETVMTAGHCVYDQTYGWVQEIWVYPGHNPTTDPWGAGYSAGVVASSSLWVSSGNWDGDVGLVAIDRAVGMLTGWYAWVYGQDCAFHQGKSYNNAAYPTEACPSPPAHWGDDLYYWYGTFDACPNNQLQLNTGGGHCFDTLWGGMSGSGAYYIDGTTRYIHAVASTSNRFDRGYFCRFQQYWIDFMNTTFIPTYARGSAFDLQPLACNAAPASLQAGCSTTTLNHKAVNATNGSADGTWTFRVYLSSDSLISTSDTLLSTQVYGYNFGAMSAATINMVQVTIPVTTSPGNYWLGLIYDNATDGNTSNNNTEGWDSAPITVTARQGAASGVNASDGSYTDRIHVAWSAAAGAADYDVWRSTTNDSGTATEIASGHAGTSYDDSTAVVGTTYYYWVMAHSACGSPSVFSASDAGWRADACAAAPAYDYTLNPKPHWQTVAQLSIGRGGCDVYRVYLRAGRHYDFTLCANDGVNASCDPGDGDLTLYDAVGAQVWYVDGVSTCSYDASTLGTVLAGWEPPADGYYYLKVDEYFGNAMTYRLAYRGICLPPGEYDYTLTPTPEWEATPERSFAAGGCHVYQVYLQAARRYDFTVCVNDTVEAFCNPGDADFTLFDATGAELWYIDGPNACGYDASTLPYYPNGWSPPADGYYYLTLSEYTEAVATTYRLAYRRTCQSPAAPGYPTPANGATDVSPDADLMWNGQYREDFNDGLAQSWQEDVDADWTILGSAYRAYQAAPAALNSMVATYSGQTFSDCTVEARFRRNESTGYARYLLVRATAGFENQPSAAGSGYAFGVDDDEFFVYKNIAGVSTTLQSWTVTPALNPVTQWNTLRVVAKGAVLDCYINNVLVYSVADSSLSSGRIGLLGYTGPAMVTTHYFDDVVVGPPELARGGISALQQWYNEHPREGGTPAAAPRAREALQPPAELMPVEKAVEEGTDAAVAWEEVLPAGFTVRAGALVEGTAGVEPSVGGEPRSAFAAPRSGAILLDFDDVTAPCYFANTVRLTNAYAGLGILFQGPGGNDGGAVLNECGNFGVSGHSSPNFLAFNTGLTLSDGGVARGPETLHFDPPVVAVQAMVGAGSGSATLNAYNAAGDLVDSDTIALVSTLSPISVAAPGITRVVLSSTNAIFVLDDLAFTPVGGGCLTTYDAYLGTTNPPATVVCNDTTTTTCDPGSLLAGTTYYWKVVATNDAGTVSGPVWSFTTRKAAKVSSAPADQGTLWRTARNIVRLTFDGNLPAAPAAGQIVIQELLAGGGFGPDLAAGFTFTIDTDPKVLKIRETATSLTHRKWYAIRNTGGWTGVANFEVQYVVLMGDVDNNGFVQNLDAGAIYPNVSPLPKPDDYRYDVDGNGFCQNLDAGAVFPRVSPLPKPAKPSGH